MESKEKLIFPEFDSAKNYPEDYTDEHNQYICKCYKCKEYFFGYKRRTICKECMETEESKTKIHEFKSNYQELFNHMHDEHGLILLESEMDEIINIVNKMQQ